MTSTLAQRREWQARWYRDNREQAIAAIAKWNKEHPEKKRAHNQRRRALKVSNGPAEKFTDIEIFERDGWVCGICHEPIDPEVKWPDPMSKSLDHIIPISEGGVHTRANVRASHLGCNVVRGASLD